MLRCAFVEKKRDQYPSSEDLRQKCESPSKGDSFHTGTASTRRGNRPLSVTRDKRSAGAGCRATTIVCFTALFCVKTLFVVQLFVCVDAGCVPAKWSRRWT